MDASVCAKPMHKACQCIRPAGHDDEFGCNCAYRSGSPAIPFGQRQARNDEDDEA